MPEVILTGAAGRIEAQYSPGRADNAPIALILHPHPKTMGHMNNAVTVQLYRVFMKARLRHPALQLPRRRQEPGRVRQRRRRAGRRGHRLRLAADLEPHGQPVLGRRLPVSAPISACSS